MTHCCSNNIFFFFLLRLRCKRATNKAKNINHTRIHVLVRVRTRGVHTHHAPNKHELCPAAYLFEGDVRIAAPGSQNVAQALEVAHGRVNAVACVEARNAADVGTLLV